MNTGLKFLKGVSGLFIALLAFQINAIELNGELTQGSLIRGKLPAGSQLYLNSKPIFVSSQGDFVFGFERQSPLNHELVWTTPDLLEHSKSLSLIPREYKIQKINGLPQKMVTPPESVTKRIKLDAQNVALARQNLTLINNVFESFIWPAKGPITGVYGSQRILNGEPKWPHFGVDVGAPVGTKVIAPAGGIVTLASEDLYYSGGTVIIDHGMQVFSTFLHLSKLNVTLGQRVKQGDKIGEIGATGRATGPHLDWRINWKEMRLDPQLLVPVR